MVLVPVLGLRERKGEGGPGDAGIFTPDNRLYAKNDGALELRLYNIFLDRGIDSLGDFTVYLDNKQGLLTVIYQIRLYIITL